MMRDLRSEWAGATAHSFRCACEQFISTIALPPDQPHSPPSAISLPPPRDIPTPSPPVPPVFSSDPSTTRAPSATAAPLRLLLPPKMRPLLSKDFSSPVLELCSDRQGPAATRSSRSPPPPLP